MAVWTASGSVRKYRRFILGGRFLGVIGLDASVLLHTGPVYGAMPFGIDRPLLSLWPSPSRLLRQLHTGGDYHIRIADGTTYLFAGFIVHHGPGVMAGVILKLFTTNAARENALFRHVQHSFSFVGLIACFGVLNDCWALWPSAPPPFSDFLPLFSKNPGQLEKITPHRFPAFVLVGLVAGGLWRVMAHNGAWWRVVTWYTYTMQHTAQHTIHSTDAAQTGDRPRRCWCCRVSLVQSVTW